MNKVKVVFFLFFLNLHGQMNQSIHVNADSKNLHDISPCKMDGVYVNNSAGVTPGEPNTTNSHGIQATSLYCPHVFSNISVSATNASVKRVRQRVS